MGWVGLVRLDLDNTIKLVYVEILGITELTNFLGVPQKAGELRKTRGH